MIGDIKGSKVYTNVINIFIVILILVGIRMTYGYDISQRYVIMGIGVILTFMLLGHLNKNNSLFFYGLVLYSIAIWFLESILFRSRGTPLPTFAPSTLMTIYVSALMGFLFVAFPMRVRWLKVLMYCFIGFNFLLIVLLGKPVEEVFDSETSSGVGLLSLTISLILPVTYLENRNRHRISILPYFLQLLLSLFVASRTGLGVCLMFFVFVILAVIQSKRNTSTKIFMYIFIGLIIIALGYIIVSNTSNMEGLEKMEELGGDLTGRELIWANYFYNFDLHDFFFGRDIIGINEGEWQNAHNTWIQFHSETGFFCIIMILFVFRILFFYIRHDMLMALLLFTIIVYSSFNYIFFFNLGDRLIYIFIFDFLCRRKQYSVEKTQLKLSLV